MCTNFVPSTRQELVAQGLGVLQWPEQDWPDEVFPGYLAPVLRAGTTVQTPVCELARFGLMPPWSRDLAHATSISRGTYNARSETASEKPSFRAAWRQRQWALAPMSSFFEPCWESGKGVRWRISVPDSMSFAVAALWERWRDPASGAVTASFSMLTVNADHHPLMSRMHRSGEEKRMPVVIAEADYGQWLHATDDEAKAFLRAAAHQSLCASPAPRATRRVVDIPQQTPSLF